MFVCCQLYYELPQLSLCTAANCTMSCQMYRCQLYYVCLLVCKCIAEQLRCFCLQDCALATRARSLRWKIIGITRRRPCAFLLLSEEPNKRHARKHGCADPHRAEEYTLRNDRPNVEGKLSYACSPCETAGRTWKKPTTPARRQGRSWKTTTDSELL